MKLPARFEIGEQVVVNFNTAGIVSGVISSIKFTQGTVFYDVMVFPFPDEPGNENISILLHDIKSYYVEGGLDRFKKPDENGYNGVSNIGVKIPKN